MSADKFKISNIKKKKAGTQDNILDQAPGPQKKVKGKGGRPPKNEDEKLTEKVTIYLTKAEKGNLEELSNANYGVSLATLVRGILRQHDII